MSCRSTATGSFATTTIVASTTLFDGQATSLYHRLRREHAEQGSPAVTATQFQDELSRLLQQNLAVESRPTRVARARNRHRDALAELAEVSDADRYAAINIRHAAETWSQRIRAWVRGYGAARGLSERDAWDRYVSFYRAATRSLAVGAPATPEGIPDDTGTRYAFAALAADPLDLTRCGGCGQFLPGSERPQHVCPTRAAAPSRRSGVTRDSAPPSGNSDVASPTPESTLGPVTGADVAPVDMDEFQDLYEKTRSSIDEGEAFPFWVPRDGQNGIVTSGLGNPGEGGSTFGLELEIDFPNDCYPYSNRRDLALRLWEEGVSESPEVFGWHFVGDAREGRPGGTYSTNPGGWICEYDRSVDDVDGDRGVEVKSQILTDTPAAWQSLSIVCEQARSLGGAATINTGLHVNVGAQGLTLDNPTQVTRLLRLAAAYDDVLVRMSHNPDVGAFHRGRRYCQFTNVPPRGFADVRDAQVWANHYNAFNLSHLPGDGRGVSPDSRIEVRLFDGSLDVGRIQAQTNLSLALVHAAKNGYDTQLPHEPAGTHRDRYGPSRLTGEDWTESTLRFRHLWGLLRHTGLSTPSHDRQFMRLFAASRWQRS